MFFVLFVCLSAFYLPWFKVSQAGVCKGSDLNMKWERPGSNWKPVCLSDLQSDDAGDLKHKVAFFTLELSCTPGRNQCSWKRRSGGIWASYRPGCCGSPRSVTMCVSSDCTWMTPNCWGLNISPSKSHKFLL